jgi:DNA-binding GntR family transcriptional regulator
MLPSRIVATDNFDGALSKELGVPLYHQIQHLVRHRIHSGLYPPGTQIPSEHDLCRELSVSRVTLREALRELVRENLLVKVQGKGTFVSSNPPKRLKPVRYSGFLEELQERVRKLRVTEVEVVQTPATSELKSTLQLSPATTEVTLIKRLRHIDSEPFSYTLNYLPSEIGARIKPKDLHSLPLLKILQEDLKIPILRARETIEAAPADPDTARRLAIPVLYPVMHMTRIMYTTGDRPFELVDIFYRADKYHYSVNMVRVKKGGRWTWNTEVETSA